MGKFIDEANIQEQKEQIAGLKTAIEEVKSAGMMNKASRAEDALDKVFTVINVIAENQQRAIAEIEDIRKNGLQNP